MDKSHQQFLTKWLRLHRSLAKPWSSLCVLAGSVSTLLLVGQAFLLASILHGLIIEQISRNAFFVHFISLLIIALFRAGCSWLKEQFAFIGATKIRQTLRKQLFDEISKRGPLYIQKMPVGSWTSLIVEQIEHLHDFYAKFLPQSMLSGIQPFIILLVVFPINWASGLILLGTAPLIPLFMILTGLGAADANRRNFVALSRLSAHFLDRLRGLSTLKLFHRVDAESDDIKEASEVFRSRTMEVLRMAFLSSAVLEFFASVSIALVAVYFGFSYLGHLDFGSHEGAITLFTGLFVLLLAPDFYLPLRELGAHYHAKAQAIGAADQLHVFLNEHVCHIGQGNNTPDNDPICIQATDCVVLSPDGKRIAGPFSFEIKPNTFTAIIGKTGSGKSSLLNALLGYAPYEGSLTINGQELSTLDMTAYRKLLGYLAQSPQLLPMSIQDNLLLGLTNTSEDQLNRAVVQAGADKIVQEKGWGYIVSEQNGGLSVGQVQRLSLARTILKPKQLLLLDEPTASLDKTNEAFIMNALMPLCREQTTLLVTHRQEQLKEADQILMFSHGKLIAQGDYQSLQTSSDAFRHLMQSEGEQEHA